MSALWSSIISDSWDVFDSLLADFTPVLGVAVGLAILAVVLGMFLGRQNG